MAEHKVPDRRLATLWTLAFNYIGLALSMVQGIVLVPFYLRHIDPRLYGAWLGSGNVVIYLGLFDFGISSAITQRVALAYGRKNYDELGRILGSGVAALCALATLPLVTAVLLTSRLPHLFHTAVEDSGPLQRAFLIAASATALNFMSAGFSAALVGLQRPVVLGATNAVATLISIAATIVGLRLGWGVLAIPAASVARSATTLLVSVTWSLWVTIRQLSLRWRVAVHDVLSMLRATTWLTVSNVFGTIGGQSDAVLASSLVDPGLATVLAMTKKASEVTIQLLIRLPIAADAAITHIAGEGDEAKYNGIAKALLRVLTTVAIIAAGGLVLLNASFVHLWVGDRFYAGPGTSLFFATTAALGVVATCFSMLLFSRGDIASAALGMILESSARLALAAVLLPTVKGLGIAIASTASLGLVCVPFQIRRLARQTKPALRFSDWFPARAAISLGALIGVGVIALRYARIDSWPRFAAAAAIYAALALAVAFAVDGVARGQLRLVLRRGSRRQKTAE